MMVTQLQLQLTMRGRRARLSGCAAAEDRVERVKRREAMLRLERGSRPTTTGAAAGGGSGAAAAAPQSRQLLHGHPGSRKETDLLHIRQIAHTLIMGFKSLLYTLSSFGNTHPVRRCCPPPPPPAMHPPY